MAITLLAIEDRVFVEPRIRLFAAAILALALSTMNWTVTRNGIPTSIDFSFIYVAGGFAQSAHPVLAYDYSAFSAAQAALFGSPHGGFPYYHFLYPPVFLLYTYPLALLPYVVAFVIWTGGTFLLYEAAAWLVVPRLATLVAAAVPIVVISNAHLGQNGFLTAGLLGLGLAVLDDRPVLAGILFGLLTYKPQFGVLLPLALIAAGRWRAIAAAAVTVLALAALAALAFGHDAWPAYMQSLRGFDARLSPDAGVVYHYQSVFGALLWAGLGPGAAWRAQLAAAAAAAGLVCWVWSRPAPYPLKAATLCIGAALATPYVLIYDLCLLPIAAAFVIRDGLARGFRGGERSALLLLFLASYFLLRRLGPIFELGLLALVIWRLLLAVPGPRRVALAAPAEPG